MPFFKAPTREDGMEHVFILAHTWFDARNIARRLYPLEVMEPLWRGGIALQEEDPPHGSEVYTLVNGEIVQAPGYENGRHKELTTQFQTGKKSKKAKGAGKKRS